MEKRFLDSYPADDTIRPSPSFSVILERHSAARTNMPATRVNQRELTNDTQRCARKFESTTAPLRRWCGQSCVGMAQHWPSLSGMQARQSRYRRVDPTPKFFSIRGPAVGPRRDRLQIAPGDRSRSHLSPGPPSQLFLALATLKLPLCALSQRLTSHRSDPPLPQMINLGLPGG